MIDRKFFLTLFSALMILVSCTREKVEIREEFSTPEKTYRIWLDTAGKGDISTNIKCVTEASKRIVDSQMKEMDVFMARLGPSVKLFRSYTIMESKTKEDKAVVVLKGKKGDLLVVPMKKEAEGWKIDLISLFGGAS